HERGAGGDGGGEEAGGVRLLHVGGHRELVPAPVQHTPAVAHRGADERALPVHAVGPQAAGQGGDLGGQQLTDRSGGGGGDPPGSLAEGADAEVRGEAVTDHRGPHGILQLRELGGERGVGDGQRVGRVQRRAHRGDV